MGLLRQPFCFYMGFAGFFPFLPFLRAFPLDLQAFSILPKGV